MPFLRLLGGAAVEQDGRPLSGVLARRHPLALLALLATAPSRTLTRSMLVGHLWPDSPERAARNRLSTCLYRVRKALSAEVLTASGEDVRLDGEALPCDVLQFEDAARQGEWERAVSLYGGELLDGFGLPAAPQFEMRIEQRRARLRKQYKQVLETLALEAEGRDDAASAARWWGELADADPYDARVAERLIASLASAGNVGAAIVAGRRHVGRLRQDLDVEPELATLELLAMLQEGGGREARPAPVAVAETQLDPRAIAVLPFANLGGDEISAAFAAGVHSDLITQLAGVPTLTVISRASVLRYRDSTVPAPEIARTLGVGTLIEGEMQAAAKRVRLNVQMIDARKDTHRWAESYERRLTTDDLLCLQRDLVERIVGSLKATLRDSDGADRRLTENLEAYRLQVVGFARLEYRTGDGLRDAICFFRAATDRDHDYALAWAGLAQALTLSHSYGYADDPAVLAEAEEAARWALELDPELPEAHAAAMLLHDTRSEGPAAIRALHRAVNLRPGYADAYNWLSWLYALTGRPQEVLESARRAARLNPMSPDVASKVVLGHLVNRNLAEAVREARRVQEIAPEYTIGRFYEGLALYEQRRFGDAMAALEDLHEAWAGHGAEATYALACLGMGQERAAREWRTKLRELEDHFAVGLLEGARGHADRARPAFDRADVGSYWPVLAVHYLYRDVWARLPEDLHDGLRRRVNAAWGLDADGHFPAPPRPPLPLST